LFKEYRRDIKRFLRGERETYPIFPHGYFDAAASEALNAYRQRAIADRREPMIESFPESVVKTLLHSWQGSAIGVYKNWLQFIREKKHENFPVMTRSASTRSALAEGEIA
jgi:homoserine O-succinyltransferase